MCLFIFLSFHYSFLALFFFFNDTATTEIYTLSLHDALPISSRHRPTTPPTDTSATQSRSRRRSEEHTSELQSRLHLVCRLLLEKKNRKHTLDLHPNKKKKETIAESKPTTQ